MWRGMPFRRGRNADTRGRLPTRSLTQFLFRPASSLTPRKKNQCRRPSFRPRRPAVTLTLHCWPAAGGAGATTRRGEEGRRESAAGICRPTHARSLQPLSPPPIPIPSLSQHTHTHKLRHLRHRHLPALRRRRPARPVHRRLPGVVVIAFLALLPHPRHPPLVGRPPGPDPGPARPGRVGSPRAAGGPHRGRLLPAGRARSRHPRGPGRRLRARAGGGGGHLVGCGGADGRGPGPSRRPAARRPAPPRARGVPAGGAGGHGGPPSGGRSGLGVLPTVRDLPGGPNGGGGAVRGRSVEGGRGGGGG